MAQNFPLIEHLDLNNFKTKACPINTQHNHKHCPFYHNAKDRKRPGFFYSADLCEFAEKDSLICPNGDNCLKAHNRVEQLYRPEKYKSKFCTFYPHNLEKCEYGTFCSFAHSENDIVIELIHNYEYDEDFYMFHFKTVWCPFNLTQHDKALCVYAHNWQDYRRKPNLHHYDPNPCCNWKSTDFILNYEDGCPFKEKCNKCHGWKEHEYHPLNYKARPCPATKNCQKGRDCPYYHHSRERRIINPNVLNRVFRYVPRNRILTNTFKVRAEIPGYPTMNTSQNMSSFISTSSFPGSPFKTYGFDPEQVLDAISNVQEFQQKANFIPSLNEMTFRPTPLQKIEPIMEQVRPYESMQYIPESTQQTMPEHYIAASMIELDKPNQMQEKIARKWSASEEPGFGTENDRLFREIIFSPAIKEKKKAEKPKESRFAEINNDENETSGVGEDVQNNLMIDKILDNEDL